MVVEKPSEPVGDAFDNGPPPVPSEAQMGGSRLRICKAQSSGVENVNFKALRKRILELQAENENLLLRCARQRGFMKILF